MEMDDAEVASKFALQILGGEPVEGPPPVASPLHDLFQLVDAVERGEITDEECVADPAIAPMAAVRPHEPARPAPPGVADVVGSSPGAVMKPSDQRPCQSYQAGHQMHWIHWKHCLRAVESRVRAHVREIREDGWFVLEMDDGAVASWWSHEPQRLRDLVAAGGEGVEVDADHHALVLDGQWFNCSARFDTACHTAGRQQAS